MNGAERAGNYEIKQMQENENKGRKDYMEKGRMGNRSDQA